MLQAAEKWLQLTAKNQKDLVKPSSSCVDSSLRKQKPGDYLTCAGFIKTQTASLQTQTGPSHTRKLSDL